MDEFGQELVEALLRLSVVFKKNHLEPPSALVLPARSFTAIKSMRANDWMTDTRGEFRMRAVGIELLESADQRSEREVIQACISQLHRMLK